MTEFCTKHREDWELFALGSLSDAEQAEMSAHLRSGCADCAKLYMEAQTMVVALGTLPEPVEPSPDVEKMLAERLRMDGASNLDKTVNPVMIREFPQKRQWNFWTIAPWALATIFFALFLVAERAYLNAQKDWLDARQLNPVTNHIVREPHSSAETPANSANDQDLQSTIEQLRQQLDSANQQIADAQRESARLQTDLKAADLQITALQNSVKESEERRVKAEANAAAIQLQLSKAQDDAHRAGSLAAQNLQLVKLLESPQLHQLPLKVVSPLGGDANARVVWDDDRGLILVAHNLPDLPDNRVYQLWILRNGTPSIASAGLVQVDARGRGLAYVPPGDDLNNMAGVVVTDEPPGGSTSSRGSQVLLGKP